LAVSIDEELKKLLNGVTIPQGGVLPHINSFLFKTKSGGESQSQSSAKPDLSRSNTASLPRAPSALATKSASTGAGKTSSSAGTTKKTASVSGGHTASSA